MFLIGSKKYRKRRSKLGAMCQEASDHKSKTLIVPKTTHDSFTILGCLTVNQRDDLKLVF